MINQLVNIHREHESWQKSNLSRVELQHYFAVASMKGRLCIVQVSGQVLGYVESHRLDFEQLGRVACSKPFHLLEEDIENGPIAYLSNMCIVPNFRQGWVFKELTKRFFTLNETADFFVGREIKKKHQPMKIFKRQETYMKWVLPTQGVANG